MRDESPVAAVQRVLAARFGIADPGAVDTMILIDAVRDASPPPREMTIASLRGAVDEHNDEIPDALVSVVVEMLNLEVG